MWLHETNVDEEMLKVFAIYSLACLRGDYDNVVGIYRI